MRSSAENCPVTGWKIPKGGNFVIRSLQVAVIWVAICLIDARTDIQKGRPVWSWWHKPDQAGVWRDKWGLDLIGGEAFLQHRHEAAVDQEHGNVGSEVSENENKEDWMNDHRYAEQAAGAEPLGIPAS